MQFHLYESLCHHSDHLQRFADDPFYLCDFSVGGFETGYLLRKASMSLRNAKAGPNQSWARGIFSSFFYK